jgi:hypothetical protein
MLTHIVLFKLNDPEADLDETVRRLRSLDGNVPVLRSLEVGVDIRHVDGTFDIALIARFDDEAGLAEYQADPFHREVISHMHKVVAQRAVVDFVD